MPLSNKGELIASLKDWAKRDNLTADAYEDFVTLVEAHINSRLRTQDMTRRMVMSTLEGRFLYELPADSAGIRNIEIQRAGNRSPLSYHTPEGLDALYGAAGPGVPCAYTLSGRELELQPCPNDAYSVRIIYYQRVPPMTEAGDTNWLLTSAPMVYLYGGLHFLAEYVRDDDAAVLWGSRFEGAANSLDAMDSIDRWSGSTRSMQAM